MVSTSRRMSVGVALLAIFLCPSATAMIPPVMHVFFERNSDVISPVGPQILDNVMQMYRGGLIDRMAVSGHTDRTGSEEYNIRLSKRRADRVRDHLIAEGMDPKVIQRVVGMGETKPLAETADGVKEPQNRRVDVAWGWAFGYSS